MISTLLITHFETQDIQTGPLVTRVVGFPEKYVVGEIKVDILQFRCLLQPVGMNNFRPRLIFWRAFKLWQPWFVNLEYEVARCGIDVEESRRWCCGVDFAVSEKDLNNLPGLFGRRGEEPKAMAQLEDFETDFVGKVVEDVIMNLHREDK